MDYDTVFNPSLGSPFGSSTGRPPFSNQQQPSPFAPQSSPTTASNLGLERLVLNDSPSTTFTAPGSQTTGSPPFGDFDPSMTQFPASMPIETMLDVTAMGEPFYFQGSNVVTEQTARLMRHYIDNLASWMDLSDSRAHFSTVAPKRALTSVFPLDSQLTQPILLNALLCFSAKHLSNVPGSGIDPSVADDYHAECVNRMIPQLHDESGVLDDALLASTVLLRMYEIMKGMGEDHQYHLRGASSLVSIQKINVNTRNLRHAAFWAYLRQDVTIALATNQPTKLELESCGVELEFTEVDDDTWTNRMTFLLAKTVNFCFGPEEKAMECWTALKGEVDLWKERAPASFKPFYTQPQGVHGEPFPAIWLLFPWHSTFNVHGFSDCSLCCAVI